MFVHAGGERRYFVDELRERAGIAVGELADAAGEGLRDAVEFALHGGGEGGEPFVVHDEGLDIVLAELAVFGGDLGDEGGLRGLELGADVGFLLGEVEVGLQGFLLVGGVWVFLDVLEAGGDGGSDILTCACRIFAGGENRWSC